MFNERESFKSYAKIQGPGINQPITKLTVFLGRVPTSKEAYVGEDEEFIPISDNMRISRKHIMIYYDRVKCEWYVKNLSKNEVFVNKIPLMINDEPKLISPISSIQIISECRFYFFQSRESEGEIEGDCVDLNLNQL